MYEIQIEFVLPKGVRHHGEFKRPIKEFTLKSLPPPLDNLGCAPANDNKFLKLNANID